MMTLAPPNLVSCDRRILLPTVDVMHRSQLFRERFLIFPARDRHGLETHLGRELDAEMTKTADPEDRDQIARSRAAVAQRIECGDAGAHERRALDRRQIFRHERERRRRRDHVFRVTAVERNPGREQRDLTGKEITAPARIAMSAMPGMPADANSLPRFPFVNARSDRVDQSDDFMSGNARVLNPRPQSHL